MENGFDEIWEFLRNKRMEEEIQEGIKEGIPIGEKRGILKCILGLQKKANSVV